MSELAQILRDKTVILLDFDGPICAAFGPAGGRPLADDLRAFAASRGLELDAHEYADDPLGVLRTVAKQRPDLRKTADAELRRLERAVIASAIPTPGADDVMHAAIDTGRVLAVVSNNSAEAIDEYLTHHELRHLVAVIGGRPPEPKRMKPDPWLIRYVARRANLPIARSILIGDSRSDVEAAHAAGIPCIGYANKPGKRLELLDAGAIAITESMNSLSASLHLVDVTARRAGS